MKDLFGVTEQKNIAKMVRAISITVIRKGYGNVGVTIDFVYFRCRFILKCQTYNKSLNIHSILLILFHLDNFIVDRDLQTGDLFAGEEWPTVKKNVYKNKVDMNASLRSRLSLSPEKEKSLFKTR